MHRGHTEAVYSGESANEEEDSKDEGEIGEAGIQLSSAQDKPNVCK